jgi:5-methylcytosine-specific restriction endonuclease McrA
MVICKACKRNFQIWYSKGLRALCYAKLSAARRRYRLNNISQTFTSVEWAKKVRRTKGICPRCKKQFELSKLTLDHIVPVSKAPLGFVYTIKDIQPLCLSCNTSKGNKIKRAYKRKVAV